MKAIKKLLVKAIFNKRQRNAIMHAIEYSEYKYKQHGKVDQAVHVAVVKEELKDILSVKPAAPKTYSETEVNNITSGAILYALDSILAMFKFALKQNVVDGVHVELKPGMIIDRAKCEECEHKDECEIKKQVFDDEEKSGDAEKTAKEPEKNAESESTGDGTNDVANAPSDAENTNLQSGGEAETEVKNESAE